MIESKLRYEEGTSFKTIFNNKYLLTYDSISQMTRVQNIFSSKIKLEFKNPFADREVFAPSNLFSLSKADKKATLLVVNPNTKKLFVLSGSSDTAKLQLPIIKAVRLQFNYLLVVQEQSSEIYRLPAPDYTPVLLKTPENFNSSPIADLYMSDPNNLIVLRENQLAIELYSVRLNSVILTKKYVISETNIFFSKIMAAKVDQPQCVFLKSSDGVAVGISLNEPYSEISIGQNVLSTRILQDGTIACYNQKRLWIYELNDSAFFEAEERLSEKFQNNFSVYIGKKRIRTFLLRFMKGSAITKFSEIVVPDKESSSAMETRSVASESKEHKYEIKETKEIKEDVPAAIPPRTSRTVMTKNSWIDEIKSTGLSGLLACVNKSPKKPIEEKIQTLAQKLKPLVDLFRIKCIDVMKLFSDEWAVEKLTLSDILIDLEMNYLAACGKVVPISSFSDLDAISEKDFVLKFGQVLTQAHEKSLFEFLNEKWFPEFFRRSVEYSNVRFLSGDKRSAEELPNLCIRLIENASNFGISLDRNYINECYDHFDKKLFEPFLNSLITNQYKSSKFLTEEGPIDFSNFSVIRIYGIARNFAKDATLALAWMTDLEMKSCMSNSVVLSHLIHYLLFAGKFEDLRNLVKYEKFEIDFPQLETNLKITADQSSSDKFLLSLTEFLDYLAVNKLGSNRLALLRDRLKARRFLAQSGLSSFEELLQPSRLAFLAQNAAVSLKHQALLSNSTQFEKALEQKLSLGEDYLEAVASISTNERSAAQTELGVKLASAAAAYLYKKDLTPELIQLLDGILEAKLLDSLIAIAIELLKEDLFSLDFFKKLKVLSNFKQLFASSDLKDKEVFASAVENFTKDVLEKLTDYSSISKLLRAYNQLTNETTTIDKSLFVNLPIAKHQSMTPNLKFLNNVLSVDQQKMMIVAQYLLFDPSFALSTYKALFVKDNNWKEHEFEELYFICGLLTGTKQLKSNEHFQVFLYEIEEEAKENAKTKLHFQKIRFYLKAFEHKNLPFSILEEMYTFESLNKISQSVEMAENFRNNPLILQDIFKSFVINNIKTIKQIAFSSELIGHAKETFSKIYGQLYDETKDNCSLLNLYTLYQTLHPENLTYLKENSLVLSLPTKLFPAKEVFTAQPVMGIDWQKLDERVKQSKLEFPVDMVILNLLKLHHQRKNAH